MKLKLEMLAVLFGLSACNQCNILPPAPKGEYSVEFNQVYRCETNGVNQTNLFENGKMIGLKGEYKDIVTGKKHISYGYNPLYNSEGEADAFSAVNERCEPYADVNPLNYTEETLKEAKKVCKLIDKCNEHLKKKYKLEFF